MRRPTPLALLFTALLASCGGEDINPTEVVLVIDSDLEEGLELDFLQVQVYPEFDPSRVNRQIANAALGDGQPRLPRTLGLYHSGGRLGPYVVEVSGRLGTNTPYIRHARFSFVSGQSKRLRIVLYSACQNEFCTLEYNCDEGGSCTGAYDIPLDDWTGSTAASLTSQMEVMEISGPPAGDAGL